MTRWYAFNGDADGLCALQQLRLAEPGAATLVTGVKRDIELVGRIAAKAGDEVTVLDVSLDRNRSHLLQVLDAGASVRYFDHHYAGEIPVHPRLSTCIDTAADVCTSLLVDRTLRGRFRRWALAAAFGDGLTDVASSLAAAEGITADAVSMLARLGVCLNYNAYGDTLGDLHFDPAELAERMLPYADPLEFAASSPAFAMLSTGYDRDIQRAQAHPPLRTTPRTKLVVLPDEPWARRVIGVLANDLAHADRDTAVAVAAPCADGGYRVSLRVPDSSPVTADTLCRGFPTGGGRRRAGGIDHLPPSELDDFADRFEACFMQAQRCGCD